MEAAEATAMGVSLCPQQSRPPKGEAQDGQRTREREMFQTGLQHLQKIILRPLNDLAGASLRALAPF